MMEAFPKVTSLWYILDINHQMVKTMNETSDQIIEKHEEETFFQRVTNYLIKNSPGMRVIKTVLAVIICLLIEYLRGSDMPYHACVATIVCMQPTLRSTFQTAVDRTLGTIIAGIYAYLLALLLVVYLGLDATSLAFNLLIGVLAFPLMALMLLIKKSSPMAITVIVYLVIMLSVSDTNPLAYTIDRVVATLIGIAVALFINWLPPLNKIGKERGSVHITRAEKWLESQTR